MFRKAIYLMLAALAITAIACGLAIDIPIETVKTGPSQTEEIYVPRPDASVSQLTLVFGAGDLKINPGAGDEALVYGTAKYNVPEFAPQVQIDGKEVRIESGDLETKLPNFGDDLENIWELEVGSMPMELSINAGAYEGKIDLGGLNLHHLEIADGASDVELEFSEPNKTKMSYLTYTTGASNVRLKNLANANFATMLFRGGAGDYFLDFSGEFQRDAVVTVEAGISHVVIVVPAEISARVFFKGGLANVDTSGEWKEANGQFILEGEEGDDTYMLDINVDMGAGNLELRN